MPVKYCQADLAERQCMCAHKHASQEATSAYIMHGKWQQANAKDGMAGLWSALLNVISTTAAAHHAICAECNLLAIQPT